MRIIRKINNNVALGLDGSGVEIVVMGKGIGFPNMPYELDDLSKVDRTFYGIDQQYIGLLESIDENIFTVSSKIVQNGRAVLSVELNPNIIFTLADHIAFAIRRFKDNIDIRNPLSLEIRHLYTTETVLGEKALDLIEKELKIRLPESEVASIALQFINAENGMNDMHEAMKTIEVINKIINIIEEKFSFELDKNNIEYSRFTIHMRYLMMRRNSKSEVESDNRLLYDLMRSKYSDTYMCMLEIDKYLKSDMKWTLNEEELLYLMLHINRLCAK